MDVAAIQDLATRPYPTREAVPAEWWALPTRVGRGRPNHGGTRTARLCHHELGPVTTTGPNLRRRDLERLPSRHGKPSESRGRRCCGESDYWSSDYERHE